MGLVMQVSNLLMQFFAIAIAFALVVQGSAAYNASPSPATFTTFPPIEAGRPALIHNGTSPRSNGRTPESQTNVSHPPIALLPPKSAPMPQPIKRLVPSFLPSTPTVSPPYNTAPPSSIVQRSAPLLPPSTPWNSSHEKAPVPVAVTPVASPLRKVPVSSPTAHPVMPVPLPPSSNQGKAPIYGAPILKPIVPVSHPPIALPPPKSAPVPQAIKGLVPSFFPSTPTVSPPYSTAPPSSIVQRSAPPLPPNTPKKSSHEKAPVPVAVTPVASPLRKVPVSLPTAHPVMPGPLPPSSHQGKAPIYGAPILDPIVPVPVALPPGRLGKSPPAINPVMPAVPPPVLSVPLASPPVISSGNPPAIHPIMPGGPSNALPEPTLSPVSAPPPNTSWKRYAMPVAAPPNEMPNPLSPDSPPKGPFPVVPPSTHKPVRHSDDTPAPAPLNIIKSSPNKGFQPPASSPLSSFYNHHHPRNKINGHAPGASHMVPPHASKQGPATSQGSSLAPLHAPKNLPQSRQRHHASPPLKQGSSVPSSYSPYPSKGHVPPAPSPSPTDPSGRTRNVPFLSPRISPSGSKPMKPKTPTLPPPVLALPPPPPNDDCTSLVCTDPLTNTPPGSPCGCVWPMQVGLRLGVSLYTFFPLVSELAQEIASGVFVKQSQVRIMGANAANQEPEKTIVLIDLVPLGAKFDNTTAYLTYERFWHKQVAIKAAFFGDYEVLYVRYPGLPPSPPSAHSSIDVIDGGPNNGSMGKPLGVDVRRRHHKNGLSGSVIAIIVLSASIAVVLCSAIVWILMFKCTDCFCQPSPVPQASLSSRARPAGTAGSTMMGSRPSSASLSFGSSIPPYTGSTKTFSSNEIVKATNNFDPSRIVGEGGFGLVYSGVLEDGTEVAVKIIKRDDQQGGREFLAEVEMLSRLHHRNVIKLIGMCTEEHNRCLVYELIPNGSVESHLHGIDKETSPLDWATRMKIALGAARGLAYLHEDSSPRVIHRDFKSSNILLENDFTPKVSDFGLARTALDEEDKHISTRVMGTFGYVAPEYAMTGHLLVKSDVYSYGVVLLELLTGKKPVDMSQPPGHENVVAWARPLLTSKEGLESIIDPSLNSDTSFDSVAKFAAIASMCVQPEVSHRPFMGEVVQALKLVCNECDDTKEVGSRTCSQEDFSIDLDTRINSSSGHLPGTSQSQHITSNCDRDLDVERGLSMSNIFGASGRQESGSFRRHSSSGPLRTRRGRQFWQRFGRRSRGSMSEHGVALSLWPGSH